ncbi:MAG: GNAT family N-acetyltransferase [Anderseniella sp.]
MSKALQIRDYTDENETDLIQLVRELQNHEADYYDRMIPADEIAGWYIDGIKKNCREHDGHIRIAWLNDTLIGYCATMTTVPNEEGDEVPFNYAYVNDLVIAKSARGQGVGKALLHDAEALARAANAKWLRINVLAKNTVARDLYDRFGFEEHVVTMEKPLK